MTRLHQPDNKPGSVEARRREMSRRRSILFAGFVPVAVALLACAIDWDQQTSFVELLPFLRGMDAGLWLKIWGGIIAAFAAIFAILVALYCRCPECNRFLTDLDESHCPRCGAKLRFLTS